MAIRNRDLVRPIKRITKPKNVASLRQTGATEVNVIENWRSQPLDAFGGTGMELIYDSEDNLVQVKGQGNQIDLKYNFEDGNLDFVKESFPGNSFSGSIRTQLDYDQQGRLEGVYSELEA